MFEMKDYLTYFVKEVALVIPTHAMCCFKLLATLNEEINLMINEFWRAKRKMRER